MKSLAITFLFFAFATASNSSVSWTLENGGPTANVGEYINGFYNGYFNGYPAARYFPVTAVAPDGEYLYGGWDTFNSTTNSIPPNPVNITYRLSDAWYKVNVTTFLFANNNDPSTSQNYPSNCNPDIDIVQPGSLYGACSWPGSALNESGFFFFGGSAYSGTSNLVADLWHFDTINLVWDVVSSTPNPTFPNQKQACAAPPVAVSGYPVARQGHSCWSTLGNLYLFGGLGQHGVLSDLWKFNGSSWTLLSDFGANSTGSANYPSARYYANAWSFDNDRFHLYGGRTESKDIISDHWVYRLLNNTWVNKINGSLNANPTYPTTVGNTGLPGARSGSFVLTNGLDVLLFGGEVVSNNMRNDLWLKPHDHNWVYLGGPESVNNFGNYTGANLWPAARGHGSSWSSSRGLSIAFGAIGGSNNTASTANLVSGPGALSDLWKLNYTYAA